MKVLALVLLIVSPVFCGEEPTSGPFLYSYNDQEHWPALCPNGHGQSPIDIITSEVLVDTCGDTVRGPLIFDGNNNVNLTAQNDGYSLKWALTEGYPAPTLAGGPLKAEYTFVQFHLHWTSEHSIDGFKYPLEIHFLHRLSNLTLEEAMVTPNGLAAIGVLCEVFVESEKSNAALSQIMPVVPELMERREKAHPTMVDLNRFLSPNPQSYFTYHGSLTTPGCYESVTWIVMDTPIKISDTQFRTIHKTDVGGYENFRFLQAGNNRTVLHSNYNVAY